MLGRGIGLMLAVITPLVLVRVMAVNEYGEYRQVMLLVTTIAGILPLGLPSSLYYFIPHFPSDKGIYIARTIIFIFITAMLTLQAVGIQGKYARYSHLIGGILMLIIGILMLFKPEWLMFG